MPDQATPKMRHLEFRGDEEGVEVSGRGLHHQHALVGGADPPRTHPPPVVAPPPADGTRWRRRFILAVPGSRYIA